MTRPVRMRACELCGAEFPTRIVIAGRMRNMNRRKFCLACSPFGTHNTSKRPSGIAAPDELREHRRRRRNAKSYRSQKRRRRSRKAELVAAHGGRCADCGYSGYVGALEFHHRDPQTKEFGLGQFDGPSARLLAEAEKCDLVCANCHRTRHALEDARLECSALVEVRRNTKMRAVRMFGATCVGCTREFAAPVIEFHHKVPETKGFGLAAEGLNRPWPSVAAELAKCVMLCANCHREVHAGVRTLDEGLLGLAEDAVAYVA